MKDREPITKPPPIGSKAPAKAARLAREAAALRANLHKRKAQARAQAAAGDPPKRE